MNTKKTNPLLKAYKDKAPQARQSVEIAPEPAAKQVFDTTTPASAPMTPRRFMLGDLPRYADKLFPILKQLFPHLTDRVYGGWLRNIINDNSSLLICVDVGAVMFARIAYDAFNPVPYVEMVFNIGSPSEARKVLVQDAVRWGKSIGVKEVRFLEDYDDLIEGVQGFFGQPEKRKIIVLHLTEEE